MRRFAILAAIALFAGCHYNEYVNKETGMRDTAREDIPTQRTAAPQGQTMQETNDAQKQ
ncbi:MAG TPA: hypothetical protein VFI31_15575 [Pirellulales bacterium]|nr:hypothetical protein [Pirellulales bacterium]